VLSYGDLDVGLCGYAEKTLPDCDRLFSGIQPDFEHLLGTLQLTDEPLELTGLLLTLASRGTHLARTLASFVH
jgi:hypothetical protein